MRKWWAVTVLATKINEKHEFVATSRLAWAMAISKAEAIGLMVVDDLVEDGFSKDSMKIMAHECPKDDK